jgi:uncharacterized membrane protein
MFECDRFSFLLMMMMMMIQLVNIPNNLHLFGLAQMSLKTPEVVGSSPRHA